MKMYTILLVWLLGSSFAIPLGNPEFTEADRQYAIQYFTESRDYLLQAVKGLRPGQASFKESPDRWSILECLEHMVLSENFIWAMAQESLDWPADPAKRSEVQVTDEQIVQMLTDRTHKVKTFEALEPGGTYATVEEAIKAFEKARNEHIGFIKTTKKDLRNHYVAHPVLGTIDSYQLLLFLAAHQTRHLKQVEEIKARPEFSQKK